MIEIPILYKVHGSLEVIERLQEALYPLGGRPHWGLQLDRLSGADQLMQRMYPKANTFIEVVREANKTGVFDNAFSNRVGFSEIDFKPA